MAAGARRLRKLRVGLNKEMVDPLTDGSSCRSFDLRLRGLPRRSAGLPPTRLHFFLPVCTSSTSTTRGRRATPQKNTSVLGGVSVFEAQADWASSELDKLAQMFDAAHPHDIATKRRLLRFSARGQEYGLRAEVSENFGEDAFRVELRPLARGRGRSNRMRLTKSAPRQGSGRRLRS